MVAGAASSSKGTPNNQVFLSFRGPDTRQGFTDCLYHCLKDAGISVFKDDEDQPLGEKIERILDAINNSKICIPIFSKGYASSKWCLLELARMVELKKDIIPIFYDVTPDDVKLKTKLYVNGLTKNACKFDFGCSAFFSLFVEWCCVISCEVRGADQLQQWKDALRYAGSLSGWVLGDAGHAEFSKSLTKEVSVKLRVKDKILPNHLVGGEEKYDAAMDLMDVECHDIRILMIHGMGGVGKSTLAKLIFNKLHSRFEGSSFIGDIRERSRDTDFTRLQNQLIKDLGCKSVDIGSSDDGIHKITDMVRGKKMLIVLDDIDHEEQIKKLGAPCYSHFCYGSGSRIIITTRDIGVVMQLGEVQLLTLEMNGLNSDQALQLFSNQAFGTDTPPADYLHLSNEVVLATGGLPLALEVMSSLLCRSKHIEEWEEIIELLDTDRRDIQNTLMISYESLAAQTKEIFLDIACFFINEEKTNCIYMCKACKLFPHKGIEELISKSLVKVLDDKFWMHDLLRDLGREIVCQEGLTDFRNRSRFWNDEDFLAILQQKEGKERVQALKIDHGDLFTFEDEELRDMRNLRYFKLRGQLTIKGESTVTLPNLRWLSFNASLPTANRLDLRNLVVLTLTDVTFDDSWKQIKMENLKVLTLHSCRKFLLLSNLKSLERLVIKKHYDLDEVTLSFGELKCLKYLEVRECGYIKLLPEEFGTLEHLEEIILEGFGWHLLELPHSIARWIKLKCFRVQNYTIGKLPNSLEDLDSLVELDISGTNITRLPSSIGKLRKLQRLHLVWCYQIQELPDSLANLKSLTELDVTQTRITELPSAFGELENLKLLKMVNCGIRKLPASIGMLRKLEKLDASSNKDLKEVPPEIGGLSNLKVLDLSVTGIQLLPFEICLLPLLQKLYLHACIQLERLPKLPTSLIHLNSANNKLHYVPDLSNLINLSHLILEIGLICQPSNVDWLRNLLKLEILELKITNISTLPSQFHMFSQLRGLELCMKDLQFVPELPSSLSDLTLSDVQPSTKWPSLFNLKILSSLRFRGCSMDDDVLDSLELGRLNRLERFDIVSCNLTELKAHHLPESLTRFSVESCASLRRLHLSHLKNLQNLKIHKCSSLLCVGSPLDVAGNARISVSDCKLLGEVVRRKEKEKSKDSLVTL